MAYGAGGGIGDALQDISRMLMGYQMDKNKDAAIEKRKKQAEEAQRLLEEKRVTRVSKPYVQKGDPKAFSPWMSQESKGYATPTGTPDQLMVSEYNSQGRPLGQRLADPAEQDGYEQEQAILAQANLAAKEKAGAAARKEGREEMKLRSQLARDKASTAASYANAESSRAYAKNLASPTGNEEDAMKDVTYLLTDPYAREAIDAGDPNIAGRWGQKPGAIESFIKSALSKAGVEVPEVSPSVMASLNRTEDPAVRAQIIQTYVRELRQAQAQGLGKLKGVKPKTEQ